eukprot:scaffold141_cov410-Prasinococcus_capsulatus_cf.AAC.7
MLSAWVLQLAALDPVATRATGEAYRERRYNVMRGPPLHATPAPSQAHPSAPQTWGPGGAARAATPCAARRAAGQVTRCWRDGTKLAKTHTGSRPWQKAPQRGLNSATRRLVPTPSPRRLPWDRAPHAYPLEGLERWYEC